MRNNQKNLLQSKADDWPPGGANSSNGLPTTNQSSSYSLWSAGKCLSKANQSFGILQTTMLAAQITAKILTFDAVLSTRHVSFSLLLFYFFDEKTIILIRNPSLFQSFLSNIAMKLAPVVFVLRQYCSTNSNQQIATLQDSDLTWMSCIVFAFFLSEQIYVYMKQRIDEHLIHSQNSKSLLIQQRDVSKNESLVNHACNSKLLDQTDILKLYDLNKDSFKVLNSPNKDLSPLKFPRNHHPQSVPPSRSANPSNDTSDNLFLQDLMGLIPQGFALVDSSQSVLYNNQQILEFLECDKLDVIKTIASLSTQLSSHSQQHQAQQPQQYQQQQQQQQQSQGQHYFANQNSGNSVGGSLFNSMKANGNTSSIVANNINLQQQTSITSQHNIGSRSRQNYSQFAIKRPESSMDNILSSPFISEDHNQELHPVSSHSHKMISTFNPNFVTAVNGGNNNPNTPLSQNSPKQKYMNSGSNNNNLSNLGLSKNLIAYQNSQFGSILNIPSSPTKQNNTTTNKNPLTLQAQLKKQLSSSHNGCVSIDCEGSPPEMGLFRDNNYPSPSSISQQTLQGEDIEKNKLESAKFGLPSSEFIINDNVATKPMGKKSHPLKNRQSSLDCNSFLPAGANQGLVSLGVSYNNSFSSNKAVNLNKHIYDDKRSQFFSSCLCAISSDSNEELFGVSKRLRSDKLETVGNLSTMQFNPTNGGNNLNSNTKSNTVLQNLAEEQEPPTATVTQKGKKFDFSSNYFETFQNQQTHPAISEKMIQQDSKQVQQTQEQLQQAFQLSFQKHPQFLLEDVKLQTSLPCGCVNGFSSQNYSINHLQKKELNKQNSIFTPQLKQRSVAVGQLLSSMFEGNEERNNLKKANSKNFLISQISECFESSLSRNHSLLGQINGNRNIGYYQYKDNVASMQVLHKNKSLVVRLIPCEFQNSKTSQKGNNESLVLIVVEQLWEDLFNAKMEEQGKSRLQLFGSMIHELRTPLNCSICFLELFRQLKEGTAEEDEMNEFVEPSLRSNQLMLNQVNDILDFVQMSDNKFKFTPLKFNLLELMEECLVMMRLQATIKHISLELQAGENLPQFITSDPNRIRQIILNFLSNALKFTQENGRIWIEVAAVNNNNNNHSDPAHIQPLIRIAVHDTGIGISKANIRKVFELFYKNDGQHAQLNPNGCGIGLPLSNSLAKLLGPPAVNSSSSLPGIQVESIEGQGSSFSFLIFNLSPSEEIVQNSTMNKDISESCNLTENPEQLNQQGIPSNKYKNISQQQLQQSASKNEFYEANTGKFSETKRKDNLSGLSNLLGKTSNLESVQSLPHLKIDSELFGGHSLFHFFPSSMKQPHAESRDGSISFREYTQNQHNREQQQQQYQQQEDKNSNQFSNYDQPPFQPRGQSTQSKITVKEITSAMKIPSQIDSFRKISGDQTKHMTHQKLLEKKNFSLNSHGEPTKVLIVDDSAFNFIVLQKILALYSISDLQSASSGGQAVQKVRKVLGEEGNRLYDIIFMDLEMPDMSGYEACKQIKQIISNYERSADALPIIACTAHGAQVKEESVFAVSQLDDALSKPILKSQIERVFETYVYKQNHMVVQTQRGSQIQI